MKHVHLHDVDLLTLGACSKDHRHLHKEGVEGSRKLTTTLQLMGICSFKLKNII